MIFDHQSGSTHRVDDAEIYYELQGDPHGPVLLCLHGGFSTIAEFNEILPNFARYRVLGIDSRGHGKSTLGSVPLTYAQLEKDVVEVLAHLNIRKLSILGFSDGGIVALRLASTSNLELKRLIAVGASWHNNHALALHDIFSKVTPQSWREKFPETVAEYERWNPQPQWERFAPLVIEMWQDPTETGHPNESVQKISCPTLIVRGDDDHLVALPWCTDLKGHIEDSHFLNLPGAGHVAFAEQPEVFSTCALQFLGGDWD